MKRFFFMAILFCMVLSGCSSVTVNLGTTPTASTSTSTPTGTNATTPDWGTRTKTSDCKVNGPLQDIACTPGDIFPQATKTQICTPGYASSVRNVTTSTKNKVYAAYGVKTHTTGQYEIDHLVSLQLGGSNDISNLWPEAASPKPGFHEKDKVENYLHDQICDGKITMKQAQVEIATNWMEVYKRMPSSGQNSSSDDDDQS